MRASVCDYKIPLKLTAVLTAFCFLSSGFSLYAEPSFSANTEQVTPASPVLDVARLNLAPEMGAVQEYFKGGDTPPLLILQDAHAQGEAQLSIQKIIQYLSEHYGVHHLAVEGAAGEMDAAFFRTFPDSQQMAEVLAGFRDRGELSGSVTAAILNPRPLQVSGVEDPDLFSQETENFLNALNVDPALFEKIILLEQHVEREKQKIYPPRLLEAEARLAQLKNNPDAFIRVLRYFFRLKKPAGYPHIRDLISRLRRKKDKTLQQIKALSLWAEWERYADEVCRSLIPSREAMKVYEKSRRLALLRKLAHFELNPEEWETLRTHFPPEAQGLPLSFHRRFYELAEARDLIFFNRLRTLMKKNPGQTVLFLGGGFHTQGLSEQLKQQNISHAILTPRFSTLEEPRHYFDVMRGKVSWAKYFEVKNGEVNIYEAFARAVRDRLLRSSPQSIDHSPQKYHNSKEHGFNYGLSTMDYGLAKRWRDQILRQLAREGRTAEAGRYTRFIDEALKREFSSPESQEMRMAWKNKIENFVERLRHLSETQQLNEKNLADLFARPAAAPYAEKPAFPKFRIPASVYSLMTETLIRSEMREDETESVGALPTPNLGQEIEDFKREGIPDQMKSYDFWTGKSKEFKSRILIDLAAGMTQSRRDEENQRLNSRYGGVVQRPLQFILKAHQLRWEDFNQTIYRDETQPQTYPGRKLTSYRNYHEALWKQAKKANGYSKELIEFILQTLDFTFPDVPAERIPEWKDYETKGEMAWENPKKVEKMIDLFNLLTGDAQKGIPGEDWNENTLTFKETETPRTLSLLMEDDLVRYFRSRWITTQGRNFFYSRFGVEHKLGFTTGNLMQGEYDDVFRLLEMASVVRAMGLYPHAFEHPTGRSIAERIQDAERLLIQNPNLDQIDPMIRERHIITRYDLSKRVYERIFLNNLRQIHYWKALILKSYEWMEKKEIEKVLAGDQKIDGEKTFETIVNDAGGQPALKIRTHRKTNVVEEVASYQDITDGKKGFLPHALLEKKITFNPEGTLETWNSHFGNRLEAPEEGDEENLNEDSEGWTFFVRDPVKEGKGKSRKVVGGKISAIARILNQADGTFFLDEYELRDKNVEYDASVTPAGLRELDMVGNLAARIYHAEHGSPVFKVIMEPSTGKVTGVQEYFYKDGEVLQEEWNLNEEMLFDSERSVEDWRSFKKEIVRKTFLKEEKGSEREILSLEFEIGSEGKRLRAVTSYDGKGQKRKKIVYGKQAISELQTFLHKNPQHSGNEWSKKIGEYQPFYTTAVDESSLDKKIGDTQHRYQEKKQEIEKAATIYGDYEKGQRISEPETDAQNLERFIEDWLNPALQSLLDGAEVKSGELNDRLIHTVILGDDIADIAGLSADEKQILEKGFPLLDPIQESQIQESDIRTIAQAFGFSEDLEKKEPTEDIVVQEPIVLDIHDHSLKYLIQSLLKIEDKLRPVDAIYERVLLDLRASLRDYRKGRTHGSFYGTLHSNKTAARQAALWLVERLHRHHGDFHRVLDEDSLSLLRTAYLEKGFETRQELQTKTSQELEMKLLPDVTDAQHHPLLIKTMDATHFPNRWNPQQEPKSLEELSVLKEQEGLYDAVTSIFRLQTKSPQEVAQKFSSANQVLQMNGIFAVVLPASRKIEEEGLEKIKTKFLFEVTESGLAFNELEDDYRNELLKQNGNIEDMTLYVQDAIRRRQFYVYVFKKTGNLSESEREILQKEQIPIVRTPIALDEIDIGIATPQEKDGRVRADAKKQAQDLLQKVEAKNLTPSDLIEINAPSVRRESAISQYDRRQNDREQYRYHMERIRLIHRYRRFLFDPKANPKALVPSGDREKAASLLESLYHDPADKSFKSKMDQPENYWKNRRSVRNPDAKRFEIKDVWDSSNTHGFSILYEDKKVVGIFLQEIDSKGKRYAAPLKLPREGAYFTGNYDQWLAQKGSLYEDAIDYKKQRDFYKQVDEVYALLEKVYDLVAVEPRFDAWFQDDLGQSLLELVNNSSYTELLGPLYDYRDFVIEIYDRWRNVSAPITVDEARQIAAMRQMVRDMHNVFQLFGGQTFSRRQRRGEMTKEKHWLSEAQRHAIFLQGIVSFLSAMSGAKREEFLRELLEGDINTVDLGAGTHAKAWARDRLNLPPPDGEHYRYGEIDRNEDYLNQSRPHGYENTKKGGPVEQIVGLIEELSQYYPPETVNLLTAFFIVDFLTPEQIKKMFIEANKVLRLEMRQESEIMDPVAALPLKPGSRAGEFFLTLPQSWQFPSSFIEALTILGFEVTTPLRGNQTMTPEWVARMTEKYGADIAREAQRMREKQFTILRLRKVKNIDPNDPLVRDMDPKVFDLIKTETGVRGKPTGQKPFSYDYEAMKRWMNTLKAVLQDWDENDVVVFDPFEEKKDLEGNTLLTWDAVLEIFPEIQTENALQHLYDYRALSRNEGNHFYFELISNFHIYWDSKSDFFLKSTWRH